jgi:putative SOS response-associated peptidase YedK
MCLDISLHTDIALTREAFPELKDRRNNPSGSAINFESVSAFVFPDFPVITNTEGNLSLLDMQWSVDPTYEKDEKMRLARRRKMANAQSERIIDDKRSFWHRIRNNRCLIPVNGTFEHRAINGWKKKVPYFVTMTGRDIQYIPGIYQSIKVIGEDGQEQEQGSFAMITRAANTVMKGIHNDGDNKHRMPLFLTPDLEQFWITEHLTDDDMKAVFNFEMPDDQISYIPVYSIRGGAIRPDGKHKYDYWQWENLPPLGNDNSIEPQASLF